MDPRLSSAFTRHGGVFATADARAAGYDPNEISALVRSGRWHRIRHGVLTPAPYWRDHESAGTAHLLESAAVIRRLGRASAVVSHTSAARVHDLVVPASAGSDVTLTDPGQYRTGRRYRVLPATLGDGDTTRLGVLPVTCLLRTLLDVGREWDCVDTVVALDDALADGRLRPADLTSALLACRHWVGIGSAARAFGLASTGAHSPHETRTRLVFDGLGFPRPMLQAAVFDRGVLIAVLDMWWPGTCVFVECDGKVKFTDAWRGRTPAEVAWAEKSRHDDLLDRGFVGVRVKPVDLHRDLAAKAARLTELLARGTALPPGIVVEQWRGGLRQTPRHLAQRLAG